MAFCVLIHLADDWTRIAVVEHGVPTHLVRDLAALMDVPVNHLAQILGISSAALKAREKDPKSLSTGEGDRVTGMARLIGFAAVMAQEAAGTGDFDPARWIASWLDKPLPALGGRRPAEFMSTRFGQALVDDLLERTTGAAYG
jgi:putative toxin-antitoxin system antitoxin component (TIGR02293 family)